MPIEATLSISGHRLRLGNLSKVFWPGEGITKGDVVSYYRDIAPLILPYLKGRPESLNRHPGGITDQSFYQKDLEYHPAWVKTRKIHSESAGKDVHWVLCQDEATLVYLVNLGCIELNPWHSRVGSLERPDYLLLDLDAKSSGFDLVVRVAREVHKLLEEIGVKGFPKTSGRSGLHVCVPLGAKYSYAQSKQFAETLMHVVHERLPKVTSLERNPDKRTGRIYLDFLQNRHGQTMAAPYCLRPVPGATVSTPLEWGEVRKGLRPTTFTIKNTAARLKRKGDLWKGVLGPGVDLRNALERLQRLSESPPPRS